MASSKEARETYRCLKNRLGIFHARDGGLLDHPYVPCRHHHSPYGEVSGRPPHDLLIYKLLSSDEKLCSINSISLSLYCVSYVISECIVG